jgi:hypothetical protein
LLLDITHDWQTMVDCHAMVGHADVMRVDSTLYTFPGRQRYVTPFVSQLVIVGSMKDLKNLNGTCSRENVAKVKADLGTM